MMVAIRRYWQRWRELNEQTCIAWPLDVFRIGAGLVLISYFLDLMLQADAFTGTGPTSLFDHELATSFYRVTRLHLFFFDDAQDFRLLWGVAAGVSIGITVGVAPRVCALILYPICVSGFHWNLPVAYIDDSFMRILLFWLVVLPVGRSLSLPTVISGRFLAATSTRVPDLGVKLFLVNLAFVYIVAGLWKWTSPYWRQGAAIYVVEQMPCGRFQDFSMTPWATIFAVFTLVTLVAEPMIPILLLFPRRLGPRLVGLALLLGLHIGITATIRVPYANIALIGSAILYFRRDLDRLTDTNGSRRFPISRQTLALNTLAAVYVLTLSGQFFAEGAGWPMVRRLFSRPLNAVGLAQGYRLFDWVGERAYHRTLFMEFVRPDGSRQAKSPYEFLPHHLRTEILITYLDGHPWQTYKLSDQASLADDIRRRIARRVCDRYDEPLTVTFSAKQTWYGVDLTTTELVRPLAEFDCPSATVRNRPLGPA